MIWNSSNSSSSGFSVWTIYTFASVDACESAIDIVAATKEKTKKIEQIIWVFFIAFTLCTYKNIERERERFLGIFGTPFILEEQVSDLKPPLWQIFIAYLIVLLTSDFWTTTAGGLCHVWKDGRFAAVITIRFLAFRQMTQVLGVR